MRFLSDENIPRLTLDLLRKRGIDIVSILTIGIGLEDREVLRIANEQDRLLVTFDKDFGNLIFYGKLESKGVVLLRFEAPSPGRVAQKLIALLDSGAKLENNFAVVSEETVRITPIKKQQN